MLADEKKKEIRSTELILEQLYSNMNEEINCFKKDRENDILMILKTFFKDKFELTNEISNLYELNSNVKIYGLA